MTAEPSTAADPTSATDGPHEPTGLRRPHLRASDADRDRAAHQLRQHLADGRLTVEEFTDRLDAVYGARTLEELAQTRRDLPYVPSTDPDEPGTRLRIRSPADLDRAVLGRSVVVAVLCSAALVVLWLLNGLLRGGLGTFWPVWPLLAWACHLLVLARTVTSRNLPWRGRRLPEVRRHRAIPR